MKKVSNVKDVVNQETKQVDKVIRNFHVSIDGYSDEMLFEVMTEIEDKYKKYLKRKYKNSEIVETIVNKTRKNIQKVAEMYIF